jgi:hypothetical protein
MGILKLGLHASITMNLERARREIVVVVGDRRRKKRGKKERGK